jgi:S1-C subfamily serine protease
MMIKKTAKISLLSMLAIPFFAFATPENDLLAYEKNTVDVFKNAAPKVIYVHRLKTVVGKSRQRLEVPAGAGSGIIWDNKGHIVTNFHVVQGAEKLSITIGKSTFPAKVMGVEPRKDIAVLKLNSPKALGLLKTFTPFKVAHTKDLLVGQKTIAIGNPFGLDHSLTIGVISALGRQTPGIGGVSIHDMIQTDASINPGNSGGPLLDSSGDLIGINTIIYSESGTSSGVGFAVPADEISRIATQIIQHGRVVLAGIGIQRVEPAVSQRLGVKKGVLIGGVLPNTPASKIGLRPTLHNRWGKVSLGDTIVAVDGKGVQDYDELYNRLSELNVGQEIKLTVLRDGKSQNYAMKTIDIAASY